MTYSDRTPAGQLTTLVLAAQTALSQTERATFLKRLRAQDGAHVADVLDDLNNRDAFLEVVEPICEQHANDVPEPYLLRIATYLAIGIHGFEPLASWELVEALVERIRPLLYLDDRELRNERAKRDKLELLAPLGFVDGDDGEFPSGVWHKLLGTLDHREVSLEKIVSIAFNAGKEAGKDELRAAARVMFGINEAVKNAVQSEVHDALADR